MSAEFLMYKKKDCMETNKKSFCVQIKCQCVTFSKTITSTCTNQRKEKMPIKRAK